MLYKFNDSFGIQIPDLIPEKLKIFDSEYKSNHGPQELYIKVKSTHAGMINGNRAFYVPFKMQDSTPSWIYPYPKPFNPKHYDDQDAKDPVGRIIDAKYIDTSDNYKLQAKDNVARINGLFQDSGKVKLFAAIDTMMKAGILQDDTWEGLGYIELLIKVIDPDTIQKCLDGRLMTGSVAAGTDSLTCFHCKTDQKYGGCGHRRIDFFEDEKGHEYQNFMVFGNFDYMEYASEPIPADQFSTWEVTNQIKLTDGEVLHSSKLLLKDCMAEVTSVFVASRDEDFMTSLTDINSVNIYEIKDSLQEVQELMSAVNKNKTNLTLDSKEVKLAVRAILKDVDDFQKAIDAYKPDSVMEKLVFIGSHNRLHYSFRWDGLDGLTPSEIKFHAKIHQMAIDHDFSGDLTWPGDGLDATLSDNGVTPPKEYVGKDAENVEPEVKDESVTEPEAKDNKESEVPVEEAPKVEDKAEEETNELDFFDKLETFDAETITDEVADKIYVCMCEEGEIAKDAWLSPEQHKKLAKSKFCGPNRSFPAHDEAHVLAARKLIGRYQGAGDSSKILASVNRKAKAMGCDKQKDGQGFDALSLVKDLKAEDLKVLNTALANKMIEDELLNSDDCSTCLAFEERVDLQDTEIETLQKNLDVNEEELKLLQGENDELMDKVAELSAKIRDKQINNILDAKALKGEEIENLDAFKDELMNAELEVLDSREKDALEGLDILKIADKLNTGLSNVPTDATIEDPTASEAKVNTGIKLTKEMMDEINTKFTTMRFQYGHDRAEAWLKGLKLQNIIPTDFDPNKKTD